MKKYYILMALIGALQPYQAYANNNWYIITDDKTCRTIKTMGWNSPSDIMLEMEVSNTPYTKLPMKDKNVVVILVIGMPNVFVQGDKKCQQISSKLRSAGLR